MRTPLGQVSPQLIAHLRHADFTASRISEFLGTSANAALYRGEPGAVLRILRTQVEAALRTCEESTIENVHHFAGLIEFFLLHRPLSSQGLEALLGQELAQSLINVGMVGSVGCQAGEVGQPVPDPHEGAHTWIPLYDIRPHVIRGEDYWVISDRDASMVEGHVPAANHVLGVGAASLSLLSVTPQSPVESVLDLGTGSGVQVLGQLQVAERIIATDFYPRALDLAEATLVPAIAGLDADTTAAVSLVEGSWFSPVQGMRFDRIVSNPPFVVSTGHIHHGYRDSGLDLDGATELVVREAIDHLTAGGHAHILGAWVHRNGEDWRQRLSSWLPDEGVAAWILQRDVADPELYVGTWLRDESIDPRSQQAITRTQQWLSHFADNEVTGIGFGYIHLERIEDGEPSDVLIEELSHQVDDYLGDEVEEYFTRARWLRDQTPESIMASNFVLRPGIALEDVSVADEESGMGFTQAVLRLTRTEGPRFSHEIDSHLRAIVAGLHPQGLSLGEVAQLYAFSHNLDEDALANALVSPIVDLVRHGLLLPASLIDEGRGDVV